MGSGNNLVLSFIFGAALFLTQQQGSLAFAEKVQVDDLLARMKPELQIASKTALTLQDALVEAYRRNPELQAARAELRAVDEEYAQAVSGFRPSVEGDASYVSTHTEGDRRDTSSDPKTLSIELTQPIYSGGSTLANVRQADHTIKAQRALLKVLEQDILQSAVTAYMDVLRDQRIVELNVGNENVLRKHLEASRQRFKLGDITRTDVSQSESRVADAVADRMAAEGNLKKSRAVFERITGLAAQGLQKPSPGVTVPATLEQALSEADRNNPGISYARYASAAAEASSRAIAGELLPRIALTGSLDRTYDTSGGDDEADEGSVAIRATIPFFSGGGGTYSRLRQSRQVEQQRRMEIADTERIVRQSVIDAWEDLVAANAEKQARVVQIEAAKTALEGVQLETDYGTRTTLNLLDAEQEYLDAQVSHAIAERDQVVATYGLRAAVGQMTAQALDLRTPFYDPEKNFQNVKNKWFGGRIHEAE